MADTMNDRSRIYLSCPTMHGDEQRFVAEAFETNWVAPLGPNVNNFESEIAAYTGCGYAAALSAGTAAIHLGLKLLGVQQGDVVFVSSLTFSASCNPIVYEKATPVLIDAEPDTWNMSPEALRKAFEKYPNPKAVVVVHLYGTPAKMDEIIEICKEHNVPILEDAAESLGATYEGKHTGTFGRIGVYSFNGNKIITTSGGGAIVTDDRGLAERARKRAQQSREKCVWYEHREVGYNYRLSNILGAIGLSQLDRLPAILKKRKSNYDWYARNFKGDLLSPTPGANHWLTVAVLSSLRERDKLLRRFEEADIEARPVWKPLHLQPVFARCRVFGGEVAEALFERGVCLPSGTGLKSGDFARIAACIS